MLTNVLPCPIHVSPLGMLMVREREASLRYRDALTMLLSLHVLRRTLHETHAGSVDPGKETEKDENKVHKEHAWKLYGVLARHIRERFCKDISRLCAAEKQAGSTREAATQAAGEFGDAATRYALGMVHAVEWCCLDILRIPFEWRHLFMTPNEMPEGKQLKPDAFGQLRRNTFNYLDNRNASYCGYYEAEVDPKTKVSKRVYKGIDPQAWHSMNLNKPPLADRLQLLVAWSRDLDQEVAAKCLFGVYRGWIDLHTLREYMHMLEVQGNDTKPRRRRRGAMTEAAEAAAAAAVAAEEAAMGMNMNADD